MDEDPDTVLGTQLLQGCELRSNFPLVFEAYKDISINEELAATHSRLAHVCVATHTDTIGAVKSKALAQFRQSDRSFKRAGRVEVIAYPRSRPAKYASKSLLSRQAPFRWVFQSVRRSVH